MQETGFSAEPNKLASSVGDFVVQNPDYYSSEFDKIQSSTGFARSWNSWAAIAGPFWGAARGLWGVFWTFMVLEILALVQIGKGLWGNLGAEQLARLEKINPKIDSFMEKYTAALVNDPEGAESFLKRAENLQKVADRLNEEMVAAASGATTFLVVGLVFFVVLRVFQGYYANIRYEKQYLTWRAEHDSSTVGLNWNRAIFSMVL
ncbi:MAG: proline/glycine betaine ABC transporter permease, partial [Pseudomonadota bacterium]